MKTDQKRKTVQTCSFGDALEHMRDGMPAVRIEWQRDRVRHCRLVDTGLGRGETFQRTDEMNRSTIYQMSTEDLIATDWRLL